MLSSGARLVLFVSSYAPLLALFAVLDSLGPGWPSIVCASVAGASVVGLLLVWFAVRGVAPVSVRLASSRNRDSEAMAYFVTYVVPFAAVDSGTRTRVALIMFAVILAALYLRASVFYVHPLLLIAGVHVFEADTDRRVPVTVLTRRRFLHQDETFWAATIAPNVYVERRAP